MTLRDKVNVQCIYAANTKIHQLATNFIEIFRIGHASNDFELLPQTNISLFSLSLPIFHSILLTLYTLYNLN